MAFNNELVILNQYKDLIDDNIIVSKTDPRGIITFVNDKFCQISGYSKEELIGKPHNIVRHPDMPAEVYAKLWDTIKNKKQTWTGQIKNKKKNGKAYYVESIIRPILNENDEIIEYIALRYDISAMINPKKLLLDELRQIKNPLLVMFKIEDYESLKAFYGRDVTELIEEKFAMHILQYCPPGCEFPKIYHIEDGVFAMVKDMKDEINNAETHELPLKKFQQNIRDHILKFGGYEYEINTILSYSTVKENIFEDVYFGLKVAENNKKDFIYSYGLIKKEQEKAKKNIQMIYKIKTALKEDKIYPLFQPIVNLHTMEIEKYESLVRLEDKDGSLISPFFFLEIAKKGKYYHHITTSVFDKVLQMLRVIDKEISINLSTIDIEDVEIRNYIISKVAQNSDISNRLVFELLEDEKVHDFDTIKDFINFVKMFGVKIAIDDFGSGHSNFERLLDFQPDILKIDGSLIKNIDRDNYSLSITKTIIHFAKSQNLKVVAEFIASEDILKVIKNLDIDYGQGYYLGEPQRI